MNSQWFFCFATNKITCIESMSLASSFRRYNEARSLENSVAWRSDRYTGGKLAIRNCLQRMFCTRETVAVRSRWQQAIRNSASARRQNREPSSSGPRGKIIAESRRFSLPMALLRNSFSRTVGALSRINSFLSDTTVRHPLLYIETPTFILRCWYFSTVTSYWMRSLLLLHLLNE